MEDTPKQNESIEYIDIGIAINLEGDTRKEALRLAEEVSQRAKTVFALGDNALPHITIAQGRFPLSQLVNVQAIFDTLINGKMGNIEMEDSLFFRPNGNVFWNVKNNNVLKVLHERLMSELFQISNGLVMDQFKKIIEDPNAAQDDKDHILKYGSVLAGDRFLPHVTIGRLESFPDHKLLSGIIPTKTSFIAHEAIMGNLGAFGEVKSIQSSIALDK